MREHQASAKSWDEVCIVKMLQKHGVTKVVGDQCCFGLFTTENCRVGPTRKATGFMTNAPCIAQQLNKRCPNKDGRQIRKHINLKNGRKNCATLPTNIVQSNLPWIQNANASRQTRPMHVSMCGAVGKHFQWIHHECNNGVKNDICNC